MKTGRLHLSREWIVTLAVLGAALLYKLIYLVYYAQQMPFYAAPTGDSAIYLDWARVIAYHDFWGLEEPFKVFYRAPLYPYILAAFLRAFGGSLLPIYLFQILLGVLNLFLLYVIGRKLFSHRAGIAAVVIAALYMPLSFKETKIVSITIVITLLLLAVWFLLKAEQKRPKLNWLLSGLMMGLSTLAWGGTILLLPIVFLFWLTRRRQVRFVCLFLLFVGWFAAISPATLHNLLVGNDMVLINSNSGYTFYQGNNPAASGTIVHPPEVYERTFGGKYLTGIGEQQFFDMGYAAQAMQKDTIKPSEASGFWMKRGLSWIAKNPGQYLRLQFQKFVLLLSNHEFASNYFPLAELHHVPVLRFAFVPFALIFALGLVGIVFNLRERSRQWPLYLVMLASALLLIIFYVGTRYRLPLVMPLAVFAGAGLTRLIDLWRNRRVGYAELALLVGGLVLSWIFCYVPLNQRQAFVTALGYRNMGEAYHRQLGNLTRAKKAYDRALKMQEENNYFGRTILSTEALAEMLTLRGDVFFDAGALDSAIADYRQAQAANPTRTQALPKLGLAFYAKATRALPPGSTEQAAALDTALEYVRAWRQTDSLDASPLALEGDIHLAAADTNRALATYEELRRAAPAFAAPGFVMTDIYLARRDTVAALKTLDELTRADSLNIGAWLSIGDIMLRRNDSTAALAYYERAARTDTMALLPSIKLAAFYTGRGDRQKTKGVCLSAIARAERPGMRLLPETGAAGQYVELKLRLAAALLGLEEWNGAKKQAEDVLKFAPGNPTAQQLSKAAQEKKLPEFILW